VLAENSGFSSANSVPLDVATKPTYTRTAAKSLAFEPVKPETQPHAPVVSFGPPKRIRQQPLEQLVSSSISALPAVERVETPVSPVTAPATHSSAVPAEIDQFIQLQRRLAESGRPENVRHAFIQLSQLYEHHQLGNAERVAMQPILDMLALKVIYARNTHILEPPHQVKPGETIASIARDFNLTPPLLRKINGFTASHELPAGTTLKVLHGQFDAQISIRQQELTLLLGGLYAGRFSFSLPHTGMPIHGGELYVMEKSDQFIILSNGWVLGTANVRNATIVFTNHDAREIFDILSEQSVIVLQ